MILTCPNCESKFRVGDDAIGPNGRKVKCRKCAHTWRAMPDGGVGEDAPSPPSKPAQSRQRAEEEVDVPPPPPPADTAPPPPPPPEPDYAAPPRGEAEAGAPPEGAEPPPIPPGEDFVLRQRQPKTEKKSPVMAWVILAVLVIATAGIGYFFQKDIAVAFPPVVKVYEWFGMDVNLVGHGLKPETTEARAEQTDDGMRLVILGQITSSRADRAEIPMLRGALVDSSQNELHVWTFQADQADILPGEVVPFETEVMNPPPDVVQATITFLDPAEAEDMGDGAERGETDMPEAGATE
jgi:predicted Zn finger-like uncharacterized protein